MGVFLRFLFRPAHDPPLPLSPMLDFGFFSDACESGQVSVSSRYLVWVCFIKTLLARVGGLVLVQDRRWGWGRPQVRACILTPSLFAL